MDVNVKVKSSLTIRAFYLFFVMSGIQVGIGVLGAPMYIFNEAAQDSWLSIIIAYLYTVIVLLVMLWILNSYKNADILGIQVDLFGKWVGKLLGTIYIAHFFVALLTVLVTYVEVIQIFIFPELSSLIIGLLLLSLVIYSVIGGLRVVIGVVFLFGLLSFWLFFLLIEPATQMEMDHFQPVFQASILELLKGSKETTFTFTGFEILFLIYPFVKNKKQAKRPVILGAGFTAGVLFLGAVVAIGYFSAGQLKGMDWSVISLFKIVKLPFIARMDYIVIVQWMMVTLSTMTLLMWAVTYGLKRLYKVPQKITLYATSLILLVLCGLISTHDFVIKLLNTFAEIGFWIIYVYPLILLPLVLLKKRWRKRHKGSVKK